MRIVQTPARYYPFTGGVERVVRAISHELVRRGHAVTVICAAEPDEGPSDDQGVRVVRLPYLMKVANTNITPTLPWQLIRQEFDLIHTHLPTPWCADYSAILGRLRGRPVVTTYYNDIVGAGAARLVAAGYNATLLKLTLGLSSRIIVNSPTLPRSPGSPLRLYTNKVTMLPNGVDTERFRPAPELRQPRTIGFVGLLDAYHAYKGLDVLLEAMAGLVAGVRDTRLLVAGTGTLLEHYRQRVRDQGLTANVEFLGFIPESELTSFFNRCSLFVLPSTSALQEGFGLVALEALACGVPVVVSEAAGVAAFLQGNDGARIVPANDPLALQRAVRVLLEDPERAAAAGRAGRGLVESTFSWRRLIDDVEAVYQTCLQQAKPRRVLRRV